MLSLFQPLMDNLESQTYEIFERDPIKYREYERVRRKFFSSNSSYRFDVSVVCSE